MTSTSPLPDGFVRVDSADPYERHNALDYILELGDGRVEVGLMADERHANEYGMVHGGVMMMLADAALCMNSRWHDKREGAITVSITSNFVAAAKEGDFLQTRSQVTRRTRNLSFVTSDVVVGDRVCLQTTGVIKRLLPEDS